VEVPVGNEDDDVSARVRTKGEDASDGGFRGSERAVMACAVATFNARAIGEGEEGGNEMVRVWDRVDVDGVVVVGRLIRKVYDGLRTRRRCRGVEGVDDAGVGPHKTCQDAEHREGGGEEGGERGGDRVGREVEGGGVMGGEGA